MSRRINRREFIAGSAGLASVAMTSCARERAVLEQKPGPQRPNVIFYFADQLRSQALSCNGGTNVPTPHIDRLARQGVAFSNGISTCPICTPYRGMVQTGRYPTHTGIVLNWVNINPRERCIAEEFADAGYRTGFIGKWHLNAGRIGPRGKHLAGLTPEERRRIQKRAAEYVKANPETEYVPPGEQRQGYEYWAAYNFHMAFRRAFYYRDTPKRLYMRGYETDAETDMAIEFMRQQSRSQDPFFLTVAPHPPHPPWNRWMCPDGYYEKIGPEIDWRPNVPEPVYSRNQDVRAYYAMIANVDDNIGRLMRFLDESGLAENTIVVFTSDHGEMLWSHGRLNKMVPYEEAVSVPLIVRWPGRVPAGLKSDVLYTPVDHMPTLLSLAGIGTPAGKDGMDLSAAVCGDTQQERDAALMMNYVSHWDYFDSGTEWPEWRGVRTKTHTYVKWFAEGREELYHNVEDPYQLRNLAAGQQDIATLKRMRGRLNDLLAQAHDEFLPGTAYADWYDDDRNLVRTALGAVT